MAIAFVLSLMVVAMVLFSLETVPVDLVAVGLLVALLLSGILEPAEALAGFGNEAVVVLGGLFILTAGLRITGATDKLTRWLEAQAGIGRAHGALLLFALVATLSAFVNNTTCTALFLPIALALAQRAGEHPSRLLMPVAFASILGGTLTVIGTSTNVIVRSLMPEYGEEPLGMFEMLPVALPVSLLGLGYLVLARRLLPEAREAELEQRYPLREYLTEVVVLEGSPLVGRTIAEAELGRQWDLNLLGIVRHGVPVPPEPPELLAAGDVLVVEGPLPVLAALHESRGLALKPQLDAAGQALLAADGRLVEAVVLPRSELVGRTLKEAQFRQRHGATVIALNRHAEVLMEKLGRIRLRVGDVLLISASRGAVDRLLGNSGVMVLGLHEPPRRAARSPWLAVGVLALVVVANASGLLSLAGSVLAGCLLLFLTRSLTPQEAYGAVEWRLLVLIAGMVAYGAALEKTGAAELLAGGLTDLLAGAGPRGLIAAIYLVTLLLTQPMSNQAAALVVLPVAMRVALEAGINPRAMAVTVALAASSSFLTPLEPSCLLVYGPGGYRFWDYPRLGLGLTVIAMALTVWLVPLLWPL